MNILIVGNVLKDVYLNLDDRTENFELDKNHIKWLDLGFNASEHHFFNRTSSLGGAAISLEILTKMGLDSSISDFNLELTNDELTTTEPPATYRYILTSDGQISYFVPSNFKTTTFTPPTEPIDCLYVDRSANLNKEAVDRIEAYLDISNTTRLIIYVRDLNNNSLNSLIPRADLIFYEKNEKSPKSAALDDINPEKIVYISENRLTYLNLSEPISVERIDLLTHLSAYSIASATILASFILGRSVENSLRLARINLENSRLNSTLSLPELEAIADNFSEENNLELIAKNLVLHPKGILAADESGGSIHKKFAGLNIEDTFENRHDYRNLFFTTKDLNKYVNGVILFDETARDTADNGQTYTDYLTSLRIIPGIKVDQGLVPFENSLETYTKGLENLPIRLREYYMMGLRFAKWRAAFEIRLNEHGDTITPSISAIEENCKILASYAKECQSAGLVPIVEPEVVYDGYYSIEKSAEITGKILDCLFQKLSEFNVNLKACILKVNMIIAGKNYYSQSTPEDVGRETAKVLKEHVPEELAGVVFLSGGQTPEQATENLKSIKENGPFPWPVTFSFARALQDPALYAWRGDNANSESAKNAFRDRLIKNTEVL